jgi:hypothetical protein
VALVSQSPGLVLMLLLHYEHLFSSSGSSVFGSGGKLAVFLLWRESFITTGKKVLVVCLAGCAVVSVFGSGDYDRKKKLQSFVWRVVLCNEFVLV